MLDDFASFSENQLKILQRYVSNTDSNVFVLRNLPEVIKGALFSRYSRSSLGLRSLLLKEFILNEETAFDAIAFAKNDENDEEVEDQLVAIQKAQNFYDRILDGYGDDSIAELGGAHLAIENVSMIAAKFIEDSRIGGSPLEKSTRYIYFDQKVDGHYLFYKEPILMTSAFRDIYVNTCNNLFQTYSDLIQELTPIFEEKFPKDPESSKGAYQAALRAKVLDCLRGLLPASALTNMGLYGNGRFFEGLIHKMHCHPLSELQDIGAKSFEELSKVVPSFISRADKNHRHHKSFEHYHESVQAELHSLVLEHKDNISIDVNPGVTLISFDANSPKKVASALLYGTSQRSLAELNEYVATLSQEDLERILDAGAKFRENRRHKSPRALEHAEFTFEIVADFGIYRDLHRHRMLTQERELLTCHFGYHIPQEIVDTPMEKKYIEAMENAKKAYDILAQEFPEEAQYVVPMAYNVRWYFHVNLRALQWLCELRSTPAGHPSYRYIAQEMAKQVSLAVPEFERFFKFVDYEGYELGRIGQEERRVAKETLLKSLSK
jgi:thymidylate synthase ThyX